MRQNDRSPDTSALYAWLSRDEDGIEGIITWPLGGILLPLISADEERARGFAGYAETAARLRGFPARLVKFTRSDQLGEVP